MAHILARLQIGSNAGGREGKMDCRVNAAIVRLLRYWIEM